MENNINKRDVIKLLITLSMGFTLILSLLFNVYYVSYPGFFKGESGFKLLSFESELKTLLFDRKVTWASVISLTQLIYGGFSVLICLFLGFELGNKNKTNKFDEILHIINAGAVIILILYLVVGVVLKNGICDNVEVISIITGSNEFNILKSFVHTNSFIGLIIGGVIYVAFIVFSLQSEKASFAGSNSLANGKNTDLSIINTNNQVDVKLNTSQNPEINQSVSSNVNTTFDDKNIDLINKYFELFEKGAITQEEFQERKRIIFK